MSKGVKDMQVKYTITVVRDDFEKFKAAMEKVINEYDSERILGSIPADRIVDVAAQITKPTLPKPKFNISVILVKEWM